MIVGGGGRPARNLTRHDVQRPRPPHVAVTSTPPACAAFRMVVPDATLSRRLAGGSAAPQRERGAHPPGRGATARRAGATREPAARGSRADHAVPGVLMAD